MVNGGIAQLGERLHGMQEVSGSIPLTSTKSGTDFVREKAVNDVKCWLANIATKHSKQYRFKFQGPHRLEA